MSSSKRSLYEKKIFDKLGELPTQYILSLIFMFSLIFSQGWIQSQVIERKFNQAVENYNEGKYATTSTILKRLLADNPLSFEEPSLLLLLKSQVALNQTEQAKETARVFFAKFPKTIYLVNIMETLGDFYVNESAFESAYRMYHRSRSLSSKSFLKSFSTFGRYPIFFSLHILCSSMMTSSTSQL